MRLKWDSLGEHGYEAGCDRGVFYERINGMYPRGVAWSGITGVDDSTSGRDVSNLYSLDRRVDARKTKPERGGTIRCYTYPEEFEPSIGIIEVLPGMMTYDQDESYFGFTYRVLKGTDSDALGDDYDIHIVYNSIVTGVKGNASTLDDDVSPEELSFDYISFPEAMDDYADPTHLVLNAKALGKRKLARLETALYGDETHDPRLPLPDEVKDILTSADVVGHVVWDDENNRDGIQPSTLYVRIKALDESIPDFVWAPVTAADEWRFESHGYLPKFNDGTEIEWTADSNLSTYAASAETVDGEIVLTLAHEPEKISISGTITWNDNLDADGNRPTQVFLSLTGRYQGGTTYDFIQVHPYVSAFSPWEYEKTGLYKYADHGKRITYTISAPSVAEYQAAVVDGFNITYNTDTTYEDISGTITINDTEAEPNYAVGSYYSAKVGDNIPYSSGSSGSMTILRPTKAIITLQDRTTGTVLGTTTVNIGENDTTLGYVFVGIQVKSSSELVVSAEIKSNVFPSNYIIEQDGYDFTFRKPNASYYIMMAWRKEPYLSGSAYLPSATVDAIKGKRVEFGATNLTCFDGAVLKDWYMQVDGAKITPASYTYDTTAGSIAVACDVPSNAVNVRLYLEADESQCIDPNFAFLGVYLKVKEG